MKPAGSVFQVSRWTENGELNVAHLRSTGQARLLGENGQNDLSLSDKRTMEKVGQKSDWRWSVSESWQRLHGNVRERWGTRTFFFLFGLICCFAGG